MRYNYTCINYLLLKKTKKIPLINLRPIEYNIQEGKVFITPKWGKLLFHSWVGPWPFLGLPFQPLN